jgi:hypothetical protein
MINDIKAKKPVFLSLFFAGFEEPNNKPSTKANTASP